jgi:hypothetical protein
MATPTLIYCGGGNPRFYEIATAAGFKYGAQLPDTIYGPLYFADQDWKKPDRDRYMSALAEHRPHMASVLDLEREDQLSEVLEWAEEAAAFVDVVMIIPKVCGIISRLPSSIAGATIRLGYSVPTKHGGTFVPSWEFRGWPVHLLGGSPHKQRELSLYFGTVSVDGNMFQKMAVRFCAFYEANSKKYRRGHWPTLCEADGKKWGDDAPYEAFRRSCENIISMWSSF